MNSLTENIKKKNTYYFVSSQFEDEFEEYISYQKESFFSLQEKLKDKFEKDVFENFLIKDNGLEIILTITGFSQEGLLRLISLIRILDDYSLNKISFKDKWCEDKGNNFKEWSVKKVKLMLKKNKYFRKCIVNLFFDAPNVPCILEKLPKFEVNKLGIGKLKGILTISEETIDTLIRYKEKGRYSGKKENNAETVIENILKELGIPWEHGDLPELKKNVPDKKRTMDFVIPNKQNPLFIVECSYVVTTSSGMGDKAKTEIAVSRLIKEYYPSAKFVGFVDGIGWLVRDKDMERMITAYDYTFTFSEENVLEFKKLLKEKFFND